jgi:hypothetical protein
MACWFDEHQFLFDESYILFDERLVFFNERPGEKVSLLLNFFLTKYYIFYTNVKFSLIKADSKRSRMAEKRNINSEACLIVTLSAKCKSHQAGQQEKIIQQLTG